MDCPKHLIAMILNDTSYGLLHTCPVRECTVRCWDGSTSTPADAATRMLRKTAHTSFDSLWKHGLMSRSAAYRLLAKYMKLPSKGAHIGMFDATQCRQVMLFAEQDWSTFDHADSNHR